MTSKEKKLSLQGFDPIIAKTPKAMILGSMPSVVSLQKHEYYGYKHNRFWKIMSAFFQTELVTYEHKRQLIQENSLILWDVIASCEREGSLDSAIRHEVVNDIASLLKKYSEVSLILCNGKKSWELYQRHFGTSIDVECICLPSTSNANRTIKESVLYEQWFAQLTRIQER